MLAREDHPVNRKPLWDKGFLIRDLIGSHRVVLDVGCGDGFPAEIARAEGNRVVCCDISLEAVKKCAQKDLEVVRCDARKLPFKKGVFNSCVCLEILEHLVIPEEALREIYRVLEDGGEIIVSTPNLASLELRLSMLFGKGFGLVTSHGIRYPDERKHLRFFTLKSLTTLLRGNRFKPVFSTGTEFFIKLSWLPRSLYPLGLKLKKLLGRAFKTFSYTLLVKAEKL